MSHLFKSENQSHQRSNLRRLASFSTAPIWALRRLGLNPDPQHIRAYLALWRHVGFYLGVDPNILTRYLSSPETADKFFASIVIDLFSSDAPLDSRAIPTIPILRAVSDRPLSGSSLEYNCAVTRHLTGDALADHLCLPRTSWRMQVRMRCSLLVQKIPVWFGRWYPRAGWVERRREVMREGLPRSVRWSLGMRRTTFRPRTDVDSGAGPGEDLGGKLAEGVVEAESVTPDFVGGKLLAKKWREVIVEMITVSSVVIVASGVLMWAMILR